MAHLNVKVSGFETTVLKKNVGSKRDVPLSKKEKNKK